MTNPVYAQPVDEAEFDNVWYPDEDSNTDALLDVRGQRYGTFAGNAEVTQDFKRLLNGHLAKRGKALSDVQREALEMIFHKISRIINGDPNYDDSWADIAGYATLVVKELHGDPK